MFRAIKRLFIWLGLAAEKATETDAINQAVVERGIRDSKVKADKAHYANGQLAGQVALLRDQVKRQERQREDLQGMLQAAAAANDEANGSHYAEELATLESELNDNKAQLDSLEQLYQQNTQIIAQSLREIQKFQREFETVKTKVAIGRSLENLAGMMKSSIRTAGDDGRRDGPIHAAVAAVRRGRRGPDARDPGSGEGNGLRHRTPAGDAQAARRDVVPGIQKEDGHGAKRSRRRARPHARKNRTPKDSGVINPKTGDNLL
jgi:hypothetical protein